MPRPSPHTELHLPLRPRAWSEAGAEGGGGGGRGQGGRADGRGLTGARGHAGGVDLGALLETLHLVRREVGLARNREGRLERALDQIREEKTALEKENGKLKYQVLHLKRSVQEADSRG